jgi:cell division protein FtsZ
MADQVLYSGVACITDLMVREGLINLDFADVRAIMRDMGKAMMGTGEASGDRRSILAAEAAIANPLLDEVSMKGAKGLLISITGGNDLTLYEVDEAASRIRQEVDEDANIILGATFDSSLDGIIRVSVVATGIDKPAGAFDMNEQRLQEAGERLRAQAAAQAAIRAEQARAQSAQLSPGQTSPAQGVAQGAEAAYAPEPFRAPEPAQMSQAPMQQAPMQQAPVHQATMAQAPQYEQAPAPQAYAPYPAEPQGYAPHHADVQITRVAPQPYHAPVPAQQPRREQPVQQTPQVFIPPAPEQPQQPRRMPSIDDLPLPGQTLIRAQGPAEHEPESKRRTLLERLANFGMSRADELRAHHAPSAPALAPPQAYMAQQPSAVHAEYAKRPAPQRPAGATDAHGRALPRADEDQLEIPAFLRRQQR